VGIGVGLGLGLGLGFGFGSELGTGRGGWTIGFVPVPHDIARIIMRAVPATSPPNFVQGVGVFILSFDESSIEEVGVCTLNSKAAQFVS